MLEASGAQKSRWSVVTWVNPVEGNAMLPCSWTRRMSD